MQLRGIEKREYQQKKKKKRYYTLNYSTSITVIICLQIKHKSDF